MSNPISIHLQVEHIFRREYANLTSLLTAKFGPSHIDAIEDAVQDSLYKAMQVWSYQALPEHPGKWLYRVAHNLLIDDLRKRRKSTSIQEWETIDTKLMPDEQFDDELKDDLLKMIFACCHSSMKPNDQLVLSLKLLCGFSNREIGKALYKEPEAIKKSITRAKSKFKTEIGQLDLPPSHQLTNRLSGVLKVIYLLFNNGYQVFEGERLLKKEVCEEALRLAELLYKQPKYNTPQTRALLALMCFKYSRFNARIDQQGNLLSFEQQDRNQWDRDFIVSGLQFIHEAAEGNLLSQYHLEAAIASEYATSKDFNSLNWTSILNYYNLLAKYYPSPSILLNRLVVLEKVNGAKKAMEAFEQLDAANYQKNHIFFSIKADFEKKLGHFKACKLSLKRAVELTNNTKEKEFLLRKLKSIH